MQKTTPAKSLRLLILGGLAVGALTALPRTAFAQELAPPGAAASAPSESLGPPTSAPTTFGAAGTWALSVQSYAPGHSTTSFFFQKTSGGNWQVTIQPALDYFIGGGVSAGGVVGILYSGSTTVIFGARAGFNQSLAKKISFWPTAGVYGSFFDSSGNTSTTAAAEVYAPFLFHPADHLFLGAGPFLGDQFHGGSFTEYGLDFVIGGWL
jgi:hypothetical protein